VIYYVSNSGSTAGLCPQTNPCALLEYVMQSFIAPAGGDVLLNSGTYTVSSYIQYNTVNFSIKGMTGEYGGMVVADDIETYPSITSTSTNNTQMFYIYSGVVSTFAYLKFIMTEVNYNTFRIFESLHNLFNL
jgi:hypothetical protein